MSKVSEYLEPQKYFHIIEIPQEEPPTECEHTNVLTVKMDNESCLICEDCGEDLTEQIIG